MSTSFLSPFSVNPDGSVVQRGVSLGIISLGKIFGGGGGGISPPSGIPRLQLPHTHPNMQANATFRVINIWKSPREAALVPLMWCNDVVQFLQQLGYPQYAVPLASSGFAGMQEPCLINSSGLQECGILDGHALRILLHQHSQVRSLHTSCAIARNGWLVDIERRGAPALHCRHP